MVSAEHTPVTIYEKAHGHDNAGTSWLLESLFDIKRLIVKTNYLYFYTLKRLLLKRASDSEVWWGHVRRKICRNSYLK